ncbi:hypothetical protein KSS87_010859 [Heliosperma pusillum]|nr:hypothetical protein KSS87_010859 [Heliosperma pusillum]
MEAGTFDTLILSRYISFTLPLNSISCPTDYFHTNRIQISVLDSPSQQQQPINSPPKVAAMLVPKFRENDWIFSTEPGHLQLLSTSPHFSRLILIGNAQNNDDFNVGNLYKRSFEMSPFCRMKLERSLYPILMILLPKEFHKVGNFDVPFLSYEDNLISSVIIDKFIGPCVGEMLVEDVEIEGRSREFRRRLRFKRMPNLVQTEICILPSEVDQKSLDCVVIEKVEFCPNLGVLVHPYLAPMVASLSLVAGHLQGRFESGVRPRGFCMGVGGGALLSFLAMQLGFEVVGVEVDEVVLKVAKRYFGLKTGQGIQLCVGDGIDILKKVACLDGITKSSSLIANFTELDCCTYNFDAFGDKFDVIMVDLDSSDSKTGISAPTSEFLQKDVLLAANSSLSEHGILVLNVIPLSMAFYKLVIHELQEAFVDLHEIQLKDTENCVLIGSKTPRNLDSSVSEDAFLSKLKSVISDVYIDAIRKI